MSVGFVRSILYFLELYFISAIIYTELVSSFQRIVLIPKEISPFSRNDIQLIIYRLILNKSAEIPSDKNFPFLVVFNFSSSIYNKSSFLYFSDCNNK